MRKAVWTAASVTVAFLAADWVPTGTEPRVDFIGRLVVILVTATCVGYLLVGLHDGSSQHRVSIYAGLVIALAMVCFNSICWSGRGITYVGATLGRGYFLGGTALVMGVIGYRQRELRSTGYVLLALLGLGVVLGLLVLQLHSSPERTVRRFARHVVAERWSEAFALLTPELQHFMNMNQRSRALHEDLDVLLPAAEKWIVSGIESRGTEVTVDLFSPRSPWGAGASFGHFADLNLQKQPNGLWLISGNLHLDSWRRHLERLKQSDSR